MKIEMLQQPMNATIECIKMLVNNKQVKISEHGYDELVRHQIPVLDVLASVEGAQVIENYPDFGKGPTVLVLQSDKEGNPIHVVWGIPKGHSQSAVIVTAYRPDPHRWSKDFLRRNNE